MLDQKFEVLNTKGVHYQIAKILGFENLSLWQRLNSFVNNKRRIRLENHFSCFSLKLKSKVNKCYDPIIKNR